MSREYFHGLLAFIAVARESNFTRAAASLGVSQSSLSHTIRALENNLGVRLLTRTTRSVSLTEAGEQLYRNIATPLAEIDTEVKALGAFRETPAGTVRITATDYAIKVILWPKLAPFLKQYPDIKVELICDYGLADIAEHRYDAGVRFGDQLGQDMVAVRIGPDVSFALVATRSYFARQRPPESPHDLEHHRCINLRLPTHGNLYAWEFAEPDGREFKVRVDGQVTFNGIYEVLDAAVSGFGLAYVPEDIARPYLAQGQLVRVLEPWCPRWTGHHLYYPSRRHPSKAMSLVIDVLRHEKPSPTLGRKTPR